MDVLNCVVNKDAERVNLPSDTSFNVSCETLVMQKMGNGGPLTAPANYSEATALHPSMVVNQGYSAIHHDGDKYNGVDSRPAS
jgi:hypothetical protein